MSSDWLVGPSSSMRSFLAAVGTGAANFVPVNVATDWLHFVLGVSMIGVLVLVPAIERPAT